MRLFELTPYKNSDVYKGVIDAFKDFEGVVHQSTRRVTLRQFTKFMASKGFTILGHGVHGAVVTTEGLPYVVKILRNDPGYLAFLKIAYQNQDVSIFPKFRGKPIEFMGDYYAVRMEKLDRLPKSAFLDGLIQVCDEIFFGHSLEEIEELIEEKPNYFVPATPQAVGDAIAYLRDNPAIYEAMQKLKAQKNAARLLSDLKPENFMQRSNGEIVLIDPFYDRKAVN